MNFHALKSKGGHPLGEVVSALQKSIRRGEEDDALYWATELDISGYAAHAWNRLKVIACEDIGLGDPAAVVVTHALFALWTDLNKLRTATRNPQRLPFIQAVRYLALAPKSRANDNALVVFYLGTREPRAIPDYALDRHTSRGRAKRRGWQHFHDVASAIENAAPIPDPYADRAQKIRRDTQATLDLDD
jgi:replication-associated recombination protein RarA